MRRKFELTKMKYGGNGIKCVEILNFKHFSRYWGVLKLVSLRWRINVMKEIRLDIEIKIKARISRQIYIYIYIFDYTDRQLVCEK